MNKKTVLYLVYLVFFITLLLSIFSSLQIYQRFFDLNSSIINGVKLAIKDGILLSDLRGSVRDISDSYVRSGVMSSSYLFSKINNVAISQEGKHKCDLKNLSFLLEEDADHIVYIVLNKDKSLYFCFKNSFYIKEKENKKEIAYWITGFQLNKIIIVSYLRHIILFTIIFSSVILFVFYLLMKMLEKSKRKELTIDIARKVKHEIVRPVAKIESVSDLMIKDFENDSKGDFASKLYQINVISKSYKLIVRSMFSYVLNKDHIGFVIKEDQINLEDTINKAFSISIKSKSIKVDFKKNIPEVLKENLVILDETFLVISISNILTNAYEAVFRNSLDELFVVLDAYYEGQILSLYFKNYGSFIAKEKFKLIFNPGVSGNTATNSGYGLTILKDIVDLYDGLVSVDSRNDETDVKKSWAQICIKFNNIKSIKKENCIVPLDLKNSEKNNITFKNKMSILVCDDEVFFIEHFKKMFKTINSDNLTVEYFFDPEKQMNFVEKHFYDLVILDLKFFNNEEYGYSLINNIRINNNDVFIAIHTSTFFEDIQENYKFYKINEFIQKTISYERLIELLLIVQKNKSFIKNENNLFVKLNKLNVVIIDDEPHLYEDWKEQNQDCDFHIFSNFDDLFAQIDKEKINIEDVNLVITDYYFDKIRPGMTLFTSGFLDTLKDIYDYEGPIILATNGSSVQSPLIDAVIGKAPIKIEILLKSLKIE